VKQGHNRQKKATAWESAIATMSARAGLLPLNAAMTSKTAMPVATASKAATIISGDVPKPGNRVNTIVRST
jgi:hypothetical protein